MTRLIVLLICCCGACELVYSQMNQISSPSPFMKEHYAEYEDDLALARKTTAGVLQTLHKQYPTPDGDLTFGYWVLEHVYADQEITSHWAEEGHWLKFYEDFTYQIGVKDKVVTIGTYSFQREQKYLIMLDAQDDQQPKAWRLALEGVDASLVGRDIAGVNNPLQIKLLGVSEQPGKSSK